MERNSICEQRDGNNNVTRRYYSRGMTGKRNGELLLHVRSLGEHPGVDEWRRIGADPVIIMVSLRREDGNAGNQGSEIDADFGTREIMARAKRQLWFTLYRA